MKPIIVYGTRGSGKTALIKQRWPHLEHIDNWDGQSLLKNGQVAEFQGTLQDIDPRISAAATVYSANKRSAEVPYATGRVVSKWAKRLAAMKEK